MNYRMKERKRGIEGERERKERKTKKRREEWREGRDGGRALDSIWPTESGVTQQRRAEIIPRLREKFSSGSLLSPN